MTGPACSVPPMQMRSQNTGDSPAGFAFAVSAYGLWGFLPLYLKLVEHLPTLEVLAHRIIWALPVAGLVLILTRRVADIRQVIRQPKLLAMAALTAVIISVNWGVYVWAVDNDRALDAALGYYINPLFSIALGAVFLKEKLLPAQWVAVGFAALAVAVLTAYNGSLPWISIVLFVSFGMYGYFRKTLPLGANQGFFLEVAILAPAAIAYALWLGPDGGFLTQNASDTWLLIGCGLVTALPLILYGNGAKRLRMTTMGILQYIAPTMIFLVAVLVFDEPFGPDRAIAFPLIWLALVIYTTAMVRGPRPARA